MSKQQAVALQRRLGWVNKIRPMSLGALVANTLSPERRTMVETNAGLRLFVDPLNQLGQSIVANGNYETDTEQTLLTYLMPGDAFLDVGANEGYFTAFAGKIVGPSGYVAAVEPQSRLAEIIQINAALNNSPTRLFQGALGGNAGESHVMFNSPVLNTGSSSLVHRTRLTRRQETITFIDPQTLWNGRESFALAKVDVEGFEGEVIENLLPMMQAGRIRALTLDYHADVLKARGVDPVAIESGILGVGWKLIRGENGYTGFRIYEAPS
jgi:FkbM family methyltransferase